MTLKDYLAQHYSSTSVRGYQNMIARFTETFGQKAAEATYRDILAYIGVLRKQNLHPKSLGNNLFAVKIYFHYLLDTGKRSDHPCRYLYLKDPIDRQVHVENLYSKEVLEAFYTHYQADSPQFQLRNKIIVGLLVKQALTVLEITQLMIKDIQLEKGTIHIKGNRKNRERTLPLQPDQILLWFEYLKKHPNKAKLQPTDALVCAANGHPLHPSSINRMINRKRAVHEKLLPLKIRQSVIAHLLKAKHDIRIVQEFAGHRRTASTEAYQQSGLEELKLAVAKLHPLKG